MSYDYPVALKNEDGLFGPTNNDHFYESVYYHKKRAQKRKDKTRWVIASNAEYHVFKIADENDWRCAENQALFSIVDEGREVLGEHGERLGFFRVPENEADPWHGFPVMACDYAPSSDLLDSWVENGIIPYHLSLKIEKRRV